MNCCLVWLSFEIFNSLFDGNSWLREIDVKNYAANEKNYTKIWCQEPKNLQSHAKITTTSKKGDDFSSTIQFTWELIAGAVNVNNVLSRSNLFTSLMFYGFGECCFAVSFVFFFWVGWLVCAIILSFLRYPKLLFMSLCVWSTGCYLSLSKPHSLWL